MEHLDCARYKLLRALQDILQMERGGNKSLESRYVPAVECISQMLINSKLPSAELKKKIMMQNYVRKLIFIESEKGNMDLPNC